MSKSNEGGFSKGFLFGGIIGAALAFLYAPKTGKEVREDIRRKSREMYDDADIHLQELKRQANDVMDEGIRQAEFLRRQADAKLREARAKADQLIYRGRESAEKSAEAAAGRVADVKSKAQDIIEEGKKKVGRSASKVKEAADASANAYREEVESTEEQG